MNLSNAVMEAIVAGIPIDENGTVTPHDWLLNPKTQYCYCGRERAHWLHQVGMWPK